MDLRNNGSKIIYLRHISVQPCSVWLMTRLQSVHHPCIIAIEIIIVIIIKKLTKMVTIPFLSHWNHNFLTWTNIKVLFIFC